MNLWWPTTPEEPTFLSAAFSTSSTHRHVGYRAFSGNKGSVHSDYSVTIGTIHLTHTGTGNPSQPDFEEDATSPACMMIELATGALGINMACPNDVKPICKARIGEKLLENIF